MHRRQLQRRAYRQKSKAVSMNIRIRLWIFILSGALAGILIDAFMVAFRNDVISFATTQDRLWFIINILCGGLYGAIAMGGSIVYYIENWGITRATLVHYFGTMGAYIAFSVVLGWFPPKFSVYALVCGVMTVAYVIVWISQMIAWKREIRQLNKDFSRAKEADRNGEITK